MTNRKQRRKSTLKTKNKKSIYTRIGNFCLVLSILTLIAYYGLYKLNTMMGNDVLTANGNILEYNRLTEVKKKDKVSLLFCGTDESGLRTDTIIYMQYDTVHDKLYMMSIPRDTYTTNPYAYKKINNIYTGGKHTDALVSEVESMLDVNIDYYCVIKLDMIKKVVDQIGGLDINIKEEIWKRNKKTNEWYLFLKPGEQTLNAKQVEKLVRNRDYSQGDIQREKVQRDVMTALIENMLQAENLIKIPSIANIIVENTDTDITVREAISYASEIKDIDTKNVVSTVMPWEYYTLNGVSYVKVDTEEASRIIREEWVYKLDAETDGNVQE